MVTPSPEEGRYADDPQLHILLADYTQAREDERSFVLLVASLFTIGIPLIAGASSLIFKSCAPNKVADGSCTELPSWAFTFVPLLPLLLVGLFVLNGAAAVMRSYYVRGLEKKMTAYGASFTMEERPGEEVSVASPSLVHFLLPMLSHRRGVFPNALIQSLLYVVMGVLAVGVTIAAIWRIHDPQLQVGASIFYTLCALALATIAIRTGLRARQFRRTLLKKLKEGQARREPREGERSLGSYLLIPRPLDLIKVSFVSFAAALAFVLAPSGARTSPVLIIAFVLVFELLVYHARYMRNDFRDRRNDPDHPLASAKRRPPPLDDEQIAWFEGALMARFLGAALFFFWLLLAGHRRIAIVFASGSVLVWALAAVYEPLKGRAERLTGLKANQSQNALFIWVGVGYGIRTAIGLAVGSTALALNWHTAWLVVVVVAWGTAFGSMFVAMTWALESSAFVPKVSYQPDATQSEPAPSPHPAATYDGGLVKRGHIAVLGVEAGVIATNSAAREGVVNNADPARIGAQSAHVLRPRRQAPRIPPRVWTVWNRGYVAALALSAFVGAEIAGAWQPSARYYAGVAIAAALLTVASALLVAVRAGVIFHLAFAVMAYVSSPIANAVAFPISHAWLAGVASAAVILLYALFLDTSYDDLMHPERMWALFAFICGSWVERVVLGEPGALAIHSSSAVMGAAKTETIT